MQIHRITLILMFLLVANIHGQSKKDGWSDWQPVSGDWVQFYTLVNFRGGNMPSDELKKRPLKSLKVDCFIAGYLNGDLPPELEGIKLVRAIYSIYGKYETVDFSYNYEEKHFEKEGFFMGGKIIIRPASQFDVDRSSTPITEAQMALNVPNIIRPLGVRNAAYKRSGWYYPLALSWRRKGTTVEIRLEDYRPTTPQ